MTTSDTALIVAQRAICARYGSDYVSADDESKVGIALESLGKEPMNGLRSRLVGNTSGWYLWAGEYSAADDFFQPVCVKHLQQHCPGVLKYLGLAPGFGFVINRGYEDVWFDAARLEREAAEGR